MAELNKRRPRFAEASFANFNTTPWLLLSLRFAARGRHRRHFFASRALDAGGLALQIAQVIQPCPANFTFANHFNGADRGGVQRKNALDANAKTDPTHSKGGAGRPALLGDHHPLECLEALLHLLAFAFLQADVDAHGVPRAELREVFAQLRFMESTNYRIHVLVSLQTRSGRASSLETISDYRQIVTIFLANSSSAATDHRNLRSHNNARRNTQVDAAESRRAVSTRQ